MNNFVCEKGRLKIVYTTGEPPPDVADHIQGEVVPSELAPCINMFRSGLRLLVIMIEVPTKGKTI